METENKDQTLEQKCSSWLNSPPDFKSGVICLAGVGISYAVGRASWYCNHLSPTCLEYIPSLITAVGIMSSMCVGFLSAAGAIISFTNGNQIRKIRQKLIEEGLDETAMSTDEKAKQWIKQNCQWSKDYYHPDVPIIEYGFPKTREALKSLAESDPRTNEELMEMIKRQPDGYYCGNYSQKLANAILTERLSSEKTLMDCILEGDFIGRTFRSYEYPLSTYEVQGIPIHWHNTAGGVVVSIKYPDQEVNYSLARIMYDRLIKPE